MAGSLTIILVYLAFFLAVPIAVGVYVYRDASRRQMNAALWVVVSILAPLFIGFIVYLLVRGSYSDLKCPQCHTAVTEQYVVCPRCGARLKEVCPHCGFAVEEDWTACPRCASPLLHQPENITPPVKKKDRALGKILLLLFLVPLLFFLSIGVLSFGAFSQSGSMSTTTLPAASFAGNEPVSEWIETCKQKQAAPAALCYEENAGGEKTTAYLLYLPFAEENIDMRMEAGSNFWGRQTEIEVDCRSTGGDGGGQTLVGILYTSDDFAKLKVVLEGERVPCPVTKVDFNPLAGAY